MPIVRPEARSVRTTGLCLVLVAAGLLVSVARAGATSVPTGFEDQLVAGSLDQPVGLAEVPDPPADTARRVLFVEQRTARVGLVVGENVFTVGTVPGVAALENERGLLGVAVDPGWPGRPYLYIHCTDGRSGHTVALSRFTLTGDIGYTGNGQLQFDPASRYDLIASLQDNAWNHNGGTLRFGIDGTLYVSLGDDASFCPAQDPTQLVGKILRLDVSRLPAGPGGPAPLALLAPPGNPYASSPDSGARLVWTVGLRNPFRFNVDPQTGSLLIADVGQDTWEELDFAAAGGMDMGWPLREGPSAYTTCTITPPGAFTEPIAYYDHTHGEAIIAGPIYRRRGSGPWRFPLGYDGDAFYLDYYVGELLRITPLGGTWVPAQEVPGQPSARSWGTGFSTTADMLELSDGSVWFCQQFAPGSGAGEIHRLVYTAVVSVPPHGTLFSLSPPWPSPSHDAVTLAWTQPADAPVRITILDLSGRAVRTLAASQAYAAGPHQLVWDGLDDDGRRVRSGRYSIRVRVGSAERQSSVTLVR